MKTLYLAGGCFWGTQHYIAQFDGVLETEVGYANGKTENPTYREVCKNDTGHAETVRVVYDEKALTTCELIGYYFQAIDPLSVNKQGEDTGTQYRTGIYYDDPSLLADIEKAVKAEEQKVGSPLAVEVLPLSNFYRAEEYHQDYLIKNPGGYCHIPKKLMEIAKGKKR